MPLQIAILGWGSLLWDARPDFDEQHAPWKLNGPALKVEFSRVSKYRKGALTLVIDPINGSTCCVAYAKSKRQAPDDAICDLRSREGTTLSNIGFHFADGSRHQSRDEATHATIRTWAEIHAIDVVVWTDLRPNFETVLGSPFSVRRALEHVYSLDAAAKAAAAEYVWCAPQLVDTPLRSALQSEPWFKKRSFP